MCGTLADASVAGGDRGVVALPMVSFFSKSAAQVEQAGFPIVRGQRTLGCPKSMARIVRCC